MKKLHFNSLHLRTDSVLLSFKMTLFLMLLFIATLSVANTVPNISNCANVSNAEDVINTITLPLDREGVTAIAACGIWLATSEGYPDPTVSGVPTSPDCSNISYTYVDAKVDSCSSTAYEIERTWTIVDSCDANAVTNHTQTVVVDDAVNPVILAPNDYTVEVFSYDCTIDIQVAPITVIYECSEWDYEVSYKLDSNSMTVLTAGVIRNPDSTYSIEGITSTEEYVWIIYTVTDSCGNVETGNTEVYIDNSNNTIRIDGQRVTCVDATEAYSTNNIPGATYDWQLLSGGSINGPSNEASIIVDWNGTPNVGNQLSVEMTMPDGCTFADTIYVLVGTDEGSISITDNMNYSLGSNCELIITPAMVAAAPLPAAGAFEVVLMDDNGNEILDATLTGEHIGWPIMVTLRNVCSGNSAMAIHHVFDKMGPLLDCSDKEMYCYDFSHDPGPGVVDNCGGDIEVSLIDSSGVVLTCDPEFIAEIEKTYIAYDQYGNPSTPCTSTIKIKRMPLDDIEGPDNFSIFEDTPLVCGSYAKDENGNPHVSVTGTPTLFGNSIYPITDGFCNVGIGYTDNIITANPCNTKIMRTWVVFESWCTQGKQVNFVQTIEIVDNTEPVVVCPNTIEVTTNGNSCAANVLLPALTAVDECTTNLTYDVVYPGGTLINQNGGLVQLPLGINTVIYTVTDECNNQTNCSFDVIVNDNTPPVAVLNLNLVVSLTEDGTAWVPVENWDAASFDDCALLSMQGMRMDEGDNCGQNLGTFEDNLHFCCSDIGEDVQIIIRLIDIAGNVNDAMVMVEVQDKTAPKITCPSDETVECGYVFDLEDFSSFGVPTIVDACDVSYTESVTANITSCGTGYYDRVFTAMDGVTSCTQRINVVTSNPFTEDMITWPSDYFPTDACLDTDLIPENLEAPYNYPVTTIQACQLVGISYTDQKYTVSNACYKIVRTWKVLDQCSMYNNEYFHDQTIMVTNTIVPTILSSCELIEVSSDDCIGGEVSLSSNATDDCTPDSELFNSYRIDIDNDGSFETTVEGVGPSMSLTDDFPLGSHKIVWLYEDRCGNVESCEQLFTVLNNNMPTAYCHDGLSVALEGMDLDGDGELETEMACMTASMFDAGSSHECDYDIFVSFSSDINDTTLCLTCEDLGEYTVELWVTDENGNQSFCTTVLSVQDNNDIDICQRNCDLLVWPENNFEVNLCGDDLSPDIINSNPMVPAESPCQDYTIEYDDELVVYTTDDCVFLVRSWTVSFNCGSDEVCEFEQTIIRNNYIVPIVECGDPIVMSTVGDDCTAAVDVPVPVVIALCNTDVSITNSFNANGANASGDYPVGETEVVYTVADACSNIATCTVIVTVTDNGSPVCNTQDITISLDNNGTYTLDASEVDNGSSDPCGELSDLTVTPNQFDCDDAGTTQEVTLTITDAGGNMSSCTANVTIDDGSTPICLVNENVVFSLDENGNVTVDASLIDNGSALVCGGDVDVSVSPTSFDCTNIGNNEVTLTVTAMNGTFSTCTANVIVEDVLDPICNAQNITVNVGEIVLASNVNDGSTDNCTSAENLTYSITPNVFDCGDIDEVQIITLTVTDENGNSSDCTAEVTVVDNDAPICQAQDIVVQLDANGNATIVAADINNGSTTACGLTDVTLSVTPSSFTCDNVGDNIVTLTVTSPNTMQATCTAIVTIEDGVAPLCNAQNITVNVGEIILASDVNDGSTDNCTSAENMTYSVFPTVFGCDDVDVVQMVTLTVTDEYGNSSTCTAEVTVVDDGAPTCETKDITIQLDADGNVTIVAADVDDGSAAACDGGDVTLSVTPSSFTCDNIGENIVTLTVTAANNEESTCTAIVTVVDELAPICTAQDITISLDENGAATIEATDIDNGSTDNCDTDLTLAIDITAFDCDDIGANTVTLTVTDDNGNSSTCTATVTVEEGAATACLTQNITIPLDANGNATIVAADIDNGSTGGSCGGDVELSVSPSTFDCTNVGDNIVTLTVTIGSSSSNCTAIVTITEDIDPVITCPDDVTIFCVDYTDDYSQFGTATATDNCDSDVTITETVVESLNSCNVGTIVRTFTATDDGGNQTTCTQTLTVVLDGDVFDVNDITFPPSPVEVFNCGSTDVADTGEVTFNTNGIDCSSITVEFADEVIGDGNECDDVITRTWTVTDACQDNASGEGVFTFEQVITTMDTLGPIVSGHEDISIELLPPNCEGFVDFSNSIVTSVDCHNVTYTNTSPFADSNDGFDASGNYDEGVTTFAVIATDECGNQTADSVTVTVTSVGNSFECIKLFYNMTDELEVPIAAVLFTDNIFGCAYENGDLVFSFSNTDPTVLFDTLTCDDLDTNIPLDIYAFIDGELFDSCNTIVHLLDPNGFCPDNLTPGVEGLVFTPGFENIGGVNIQLEGEGGADYMTSALGSYEFMDVTESGTYNVLPHKDDDHLNGVSTLDLILIQRHILGLKKFDSAYQMIAADVNKNGKVNVSDLIALRQLILGKTDHFENNTSWRFIDANHEDWEMNSVLGEDIPENYYIPSLNNMMYINWIGIKVGDVNESVAANEFVGSYEDIYRSTNILVVENESVEMDEDYILRFKVSEEQEMFGFQFTVSFNPSMMEYVGLESSELGLTEDNIGDYYAERGQLAISWNDIDKSLISKKDDIVSLRFKAKKQTNISECFSINSGLIDAEWYNDDIKELKIVFNESDESDIQLISNTPNPWAEYTNINFYLPKRMDVEFTIYDLAGRKLITKDGNYNEGLNTITIEQSELNADGVLYYEIKTSTRKIIKKMIALKK